LYQESAYKRVEQNSEALVKGNIPWWKDKWTIIMNKIVLTVAIICTLFGPKNLPGQVFLICRKVWVLDYLLFLTALTYFNGTETTKIFLIIFMKNITILY